MPQLISTAPDGRPCSPGCTVTSPPSAGPASIPSRMSTLQGVGGIPRQRRRRQNSRSRTAATRGPDSSSRPAGRAARANFQPGKRSTASPYKQVRARIEQVFARMKAWKILRDCRLKVDGVHYAVLGIARLHNLALRGRSTGSPKSAVSESTRRVGAPSPRKAADWDSRCERGALGVHRS